MDVATTKTTKKPDYTIHLNIGTALGKRLRRLAEAERRTMHNLAVLMIEDGVAQKENGNVGKS